MGAYASQLTILTTLGFACREDHKAKAAEAATC